MEVVTENKVLEFVDGFEQQNSSSEVRTQALNALRNMDFPTTRVEEWKYTRVTKYTKKLYRQLREELEENNNYYIKGLKSHRLVFVNGFFNKNLSDIISEDDALSIQEIEQIDEEYYTKLLNDVEENVFSLINKAYQTGGVFLKIKKDKKAKYPIHLIHILKGEEVIANIRHFVQMESGSKAEIVVSFNSENSSNSFTNVVFEGNLQVDSDLTINKLQSENKDVLHISRELFIQEHRSNFVINTFTIGSILTRNQLDVFVEGSNCYTELNGAYLGEAKQHLDNHTYINQSSSYCTTNELYKGVLDDQSTGVFNGMILVQPDIRQINAYQSNKNILLSEKANINSKPELEIYSDDVRCSHGSTTGQLDEEAVFYLQSRGISREKAKQLLVAAFINDVTDKINNEIVKEYIADKIQPVYSRVF